VVGLALAAADASSSVDDLDAQLARGIRQVRGGHFSAAIFTLDTVARQLAARDRASDLARACLFLAVAHIELGSRSRAEELAAAAFANPALEYSKGDFAPRHQAFFEQVQERVRRLKTGEGALLPSGEVPTGDEGTTEGTASAADAGEEQGGGSSAILWVGLAATAAGVGAVLASGGKDSPAPGSPPGSSTAPVDNDRDGFSVAEGDCNDGDPSIHPNGEVSAAVLSSIAYQTIRCGSIEELSIFLTNRSCSPVSVYRIDWQLDIIGGNCSFADGSTTWRSTRAPTDSEVARGVGETIWSHSRNTGGCCWGRCQGLRCTYLSTLAVDTNVGPIAAGAYQYDKLYTGCPPCTGAAMGELAGLAAIR
jgi:hypothetical protein